jgi:hypothetical protein
VQEVRLSPRGLPISTTTSHEVANGEIMRVLRWGGGIRGPAESTYPHPNGCTFSELRTPTPLDKLETKHLTAAFRLAIEAEPNCRKYWDALYEMPWKALATKYSNGFLTPKDYMSHFKNILHHGICLRSVRPHEGKSSCRCCGKYIENTNHLAECSVLRKVWLRFSRLASATHGRTPLTHALIFHALDKEGRMLPPALSALHLILWKMVIFNFTTVDTDGNRFRPSKVWSDALRRYETRLSARAFKVTRNAIATMRRGERTREPDAENRRIAPLACMNEWGHVTMHEALTTAIADSRPTPPPPASGDG